MKASRREVRWLAGGDAFYDATGKHVGDFVGKIVYALSGEYFGELYGSRWIEHTTVARSPREPEVGYASIASRRLVDKRDAWSADGTIQSARIVKHLDSGLPWPS